MKSIIYLSVSLYLNSDMSQEEVDDLISEVEYDFNHYNISHTIINGEVE